MAAMTLEPRDPDMSNFIDSYKFERQMAERRDKFGGGTSLPLNSDGYEDRQRFLRDERHKDWAEQQEKDISYKPTINPYPHPKLTSGPQNPRNYDVEIQKMTDRYHNKYDDVLVKGNEQQRKIEQERLEQRRQNRQPPAPPQANQIDYNQAHELTKAEDRRAYQDYQGKFTIPIEGKMHVRPPVSYEENKKVLAEERRREYGLYQEQKAKEERYRAMRGRPVTPAGGLDIGKYDRQVKEEAASKKKEYKSMLDQQQKEQRFLKAQQEPEISVLDRKQASHSPYLATKPPAGPTYKPRDEAFQTNTYTRPRSRGERQEQGYVPSLSDAPIRGQFYEERSRPPHSDLQPPRTPPRRTPPPRTPSRRTPPRRDFEESMEQSRVQPRSPRRSPPPRTPPPREREQHNQNTSRQPHIDVSPRRHKAMDMEESQYDRMRKQANLERKDEYEKYLKYKEEERHNKSSHRPVGKPAEVVKGPYYNSDNYESFQNELRQKQLDEYRDYLKKTTHAPRNRSWKESENGLLLPEDHTIEYKKRELQAERKREYNEHLAQCKRPPNHFWPEPDPGAGALWLKKGEYDGVKQMYEDERRKEYFEACEQKRQPDISLPPRSKSQPVLTRGKYFNPMLDAMGRYEDFRQKLKGIRRKEFLDFMDKAKHKWSEKRFGGQPPKLAKEENPMVYSMGMYERDQMKKVREERHKDLAKFYEEQRKNMSPRRYEEEMPRLATAEDPLVNHMGNYDREKEKFALQRHKDFRDFSKKYQQQHHSPWNNFIYPVNAYLEHPVVEKMGHELEQKRRMLRDERKREYERYLNEQRMHEVPRRDNYGSNVQGPYNGMFHGLGEHGNQKDELNQQRRQDYNTRLDQQYTQRERPSGRPSWAKDPVMDEPGDGGRPSVRSPTKGDQYGDMLNEKRREEAQRRRFDDPEYQDKLARIDSRERRGPGLDQPRYGY